ncbi:MAG TPA: type II secretion system major pseudopilin GspG [Sulfurovum sp.]|jgi:general secretion pathway protein G|nr:MAG: type II secretion system protein GspG [Sulfurovum sp. 35-42-20]OYY54895.1 MAG: type II secretion system protein GspG [Sulfurovum sp. 28-43-6]OYZ25093.1 MAG: type II secretion system protein GspG [Sulfurovum sp. 16-42-52]OYZ48936.1 MAG: type II secretion system protein GspG [Sulfurovum sp. 24-42-9]OZA45073.1 MAG: type II secretion system protein GspG [Sulfurovum sp. 17-42-90]OZA59820.1 MAG: type II secretion system protein GspG [Sulfurovum sp. 39-42-12]HQR73666.1 type II secretion syst
MTRNTPLRAGFSLIELLIVIVILGGLVAVVAPGLMDAADGAKRDTVCLKMNDLKKRFDMFSLDNGTYPDTEEGFEALLSNPDADKYPNYREKPYLKELPKDSWKTPFIYIKKGSDIELISYGADRKEGGEESNKDILFSECSK